jgi:uncharacterized SAM-binding protein YcdF (DUF218 family)
MNWRHSISWRKLIISLVAIPFAWLLFLTTSIIWYANQSDEGHADAAIVLGAAVARGAPTPVFEQRIKHAVDLYHAGRVRVLILTGGVGGGDTLAESEVARQYCLDRGVPPEDIAIETLSHSTRENLIYAQQLLVERGLGRTLIVSDPIHMRRAVTEARDLGIDAYPSPTPTSRYIGIASRSRFVAREVYFYARYLLQRTFTSNSEVAARSSAFHRSASVVCLS